MATKKKADGFTPKVLADMGTHVIVSVAMRLERCGECQRPMMPLWEEVYWDMATFKTRDMLCKMLPAQAKNAKWPLVTWFARNSAGEPVCDECVMRLEMKFQCTVCKQLRAFPQVHEHIGNPPRYFCITCYETSLAENVWARLCFEAESAFQEELAQSEVGAGRVLAGGTVPPQRRAEVVHARKKSGS